MVSGIGGIQGIQRSLAAAQDEFNTRSQRFASGKRINSAKDDAAGLAVAASLLADSTTFRRGSQNASDAVSLTEIADGALTQISDLATRINELTIQASNGTYSDAQRGALQSEATALKEEISRIAATTTFNDRPVFSGSSTSIQVGTDSQASSAVVIEGVDLATLASSISADFSSQSSARSAIEGLDTFRNAVSQARGTIGASSSRISYAQANSDIQADEALTAASRIVDADIAAEASGLKNAQTRQQLAANVLNNATQAGSNLTSLLSRRA